MGYPGFLNNGMGLGLGLLNHYKDEEVRYLIGVRFNPIINIGICKNRINSRRRIRGQKIIINNNNVINNN